MYKESDFLVINIRALTRNRKAKLIVLTLVSLSLMIFIFKYLNNSKELPQELSFEGYEILINNELVGKVKSVGQLDIILAGLEKELAAANEANIKIDKESFKLSKVLLKESDLTEESQLINNIKKNLEYKFQCYVISIEGNDVVYASSQEDAEEILDRIKSIYMPDVKEGEDIEVISTNIAEDVLIKPTLADFSQIMSIDDTVKYLLKGTMEDKIYTVKKGDSLWSISRAYDMEVDDIISANPNINPTLIHIGDKINLIVPKPLLNIEIAYLHTYNQTIGYPVSTKTDPNLPRNKTIIEKAGKPGQKEITEEVVIKNGCFVSSQVIKQNIISDPELQIVIQGTKRLPEDDMTSAFLPMGTGLITSRFGIRWGRHHNGIDVSVPIGTSVYSCMDGVVTFSGWKDGYGRLVIIDHKNGYVSYYGHNSKLLVSVGDEVKKKQKIALSGNSGRSTGPHVHFEVHKDNKLIDPLTFLKNN